MATPLSGRRRETLAFIAATILAFAAFAGFSKSAEAALLPAPDILDGPANGVTLDTNQASFVFDYLAPITGGTLTGYLCTIDGSPIPCNGTADLVDLSAGVHTFGVAAQLSLLGGDPICVLTICVDPEVAVVTDAATRTFSINLLGTQVGDPGSNGNNGSNGAGGANGANGANGTNNVVGANAFAVAWAKYKRQKALCLRQKHRIKKYKRAKTRKAARKRYNTCVKRQKKLRAAALAVAR